MTTLHISTHHCDDLSSAYGDYDFSGCDRVVVGKTARLARAFANNASLAGKVLLSENRDAPVDASGAFVNCSGLTAFPSTDTGRTKDYAYTQGMFRGCSSLTGFSPWSCSPVLCQRMYYGCTSWDGHGIAGLSFANTAHTNSMLELCKGVPLSNQNLAHLLRSIRDTLPEGAVRRGVNVGCGHADALTMRLMDSIDAGVDIVHDGTQEVWDYDFDHAVGEYVDAGASLFTSDSVSFDGVTGLGGHFVTPYNGCLVSPRWGVFANHYMPPVGFKARTLSGETLTVTKVVRGPGDLGVCRFAETATTQPVTVLDNEMLHEYMYRDGYCEEAFGSGIPAFAYDRFEKPCLFELYNFSKHGGGGANIGSVINLDGPAKHFTAGDSGSIFFIVGHDMHALAVSETFSAGGGGTSIGHNKAWIQSVTGEPLTLGT